MPLPISKIPSEQGIRQFNRDSRSQKPFHAFIAGFLVREHGRESALFQEQDENYYRYRISGVREAGVARHLLRRRRFE